MNATFEKRTNGFWCQIDDDGKLFDIAKHGNDWKRCERAAQTWFVETSNFHHPRVSLSQCHLSATRLQLVVDCVADYFPNQNDDFKFVLDEFAGCLGVLFGSMFVTESDEGFNVEMVINWLTKERVTVCTGVALDVAAEIVRNSESSRSFRCIEPRRLSLSKLNRFILANVWRLFK